MLALDKSCANEKFNGPIGVNQSMVIPVDDLILFELSINVKVCLARNPGWKKCSLKRKICTFLRD